VYFEELAPLPLAEMLMIEPHRIMSRIAEAVQVYPPSSWTNTSAGLPSLSRRKSIKGSPPCFSNTGIGSRHFITTTEDDGTVATKTKKALDSQRKPKLFDSRGDKTAIELFLGGVGGREAGLRRRFDDDKSKPQ
jgi:hypothetical protein